MLLMLKNPFPKANSIPKIHKEFLHDFGICPPPKHTFLYGVKGRLYLTASQLKYIPQDFGNVRFVWNFFLDLLQHLYKRTLAYAKDNNIKLYNKKHESISKNWKKLPKGLKFPSFTTLNKLLTALKKQKTWLKKSDSKAIQDELKNLHNTYERCFQHLCASPNHKSKKSHFQSFTTDSASVIGRKFFHGHSHGYIPKFKKVSFRLNRKHIYGSVKSVTVMLKPDGHFYISLTMQYENQILPKTNKMVGIDVGKAHFLTLSDGQMWDYKYNDLKVEHKAKRYQSKTGHTGHLASNRIKINKHYIKKYPGKKGNDSLKTHISEFHRHNRYRIRHARCSAKLRHKRYDYLQKITTWLVLNYDVIAIEDLNVKQMLKSNGTIKNHEITQACWREFRDILTYKCKWYGKELILVNPAYTSQICYLCHTWCGKHPVSKRAWYCKNKKCPYFKKKVNRDICSAKYILQLALGQVSPFIYKQINKYKHASLRQLRWFTKTTIASKQAVIFQANNLKHLRQYKMGLRFGTNRKVDASCVPVK